MLDFVFIVILFLIVFLMFMVCFFAFDSIILGGVVGRALKRWASNTFESGCNQDCNQGRNCKCGK